MPKKRGRRRYRGRRVKPLEAMVADVVVNHVGPWLRMATAGGKKPFVITELRAFLRRTGATCFRAIIENQAQASGAVAIERESGMGYVDAPRLDRWLRKQGTNETTEAPEAAHGAYDESAATGTDEGESGDGSGVVAPEEGSKRGDDSSR